MFYLTLRSQRKAHATINIFVRKGVILSYEMTAFFDKWNAFANEKSI